MGIYLRQTAQGGISANGDDGGESEKEGVFVELPRGMFLIAHLGKSSLLNDLGKNARHHRTDYKR